jgi:putative transposase
MWLWVAIKPKDKEILGMSISKERNVFVAERFLSKVVEEYGQHIISTKDGGTWYTQACKFLKIDHHIHFLYIWLRKASLKEQCNT